MPSHHWPSTAKPLYICSSYHTNRFSVTPKRHQQGKWRLILDLFFSTRSQCEHRNQQTPGFLQCATVDDVARIVSDIGPDSQMVMVDIAHAYRNTPVHLQEGPLLGMLWANHLYIDTVLPFDLCSVPKILCTVSDAVEWIT